MISTEVRAISLEIEDGYQDPVVCLNEYLKIELFTFCNIIQQNVFI